MSFKDIFEAKQRLLEGNRRFVTGKSESKKINFEEIENLAVNGQNPFALIVCCSDSRVPPELIFDQGFGQIFVVRTAGNVLDEIGFGSVEYGAEHLHIPLIVVLGHENCGAVKATIEGGEAHGAVKSIIDKIDYSLKKLNKPVNIYEECTDENIRNTVREICDNAVIAKLIKEDKTGVVGAKYGIHSGAVTFF
jgi:carbonic anhydrase